MENVHKKTQNSTLKASMIKTEEWPPTVTVYPRSSSESSLTSFDDNDIIAFGPINVKRRRKPAPTLATGRRSKYEILTPEEAHKRDIRRARNRAAAERVRINRLNVEQQLQGKIDELENQEQNLLDIIELLQSQKLQLEMRLVTYEKLCSSRSLPNAQNYLIPAVLSTSAPTSATSQQVSSFCFEDLFSDSPTPAETQPDNFSNSLPILMPIDELDIFLMDICK
ncbi:unnamed protein product [Rotaria magnacalcarata]|uniref:BZIP domain-containing protein n=2 Tax=Rotaria magnacalcarata TaxID=392030 RepID=A0A820AGW5_9BILA|nr:unnamed protein product [Rotaria magnacalcarata]CAF4214534.1 unnamed protein product [Rotaria magnacalcarata]